MWEKVESHSLKHNHFSNGIAFQSFTTLFQEQVTFETLYSAWPAKTSFIYTLYAAGVCAAGRQSIFKVKILWGLSLNKKFCAKSKENGPFCEGSVLLYGTRQEKIGPGDADIGQKIY